MSSSSENSSASTTSPSLPSQASVFTISIVPSIGKFPFPPFLASSTNSLITQKRDEQEIRLKLEEIISVATERGYSPGADWSIHDIEEEEKENVTGIHSEKLALALGLLRTVPGTTIRIVKNLRICGDCHSLMKYVSKMSQRDILLRDARQFHHFKNGSCSCGDYW
ncbi:Pentatricopeptide repeat-containing protein [Cardamine amara subsp. amara]|uniref:Pentatricopeptide repeat-containing protein n=1 Tax=Cardamine amara subsp. amara TaxID=228776 RepID=A0ABD1BDY5_CARAN